MVRRVHICYVFTSVTSSNREETEVHFLSLTLSFPSSTSPLSIGEYLTFADVPQVLKARREKTQEAEVATPKVQHSECFKKFNQNPFVVTHSHILCKNKIQVILRAELILTKAGLGSFGWASENKT